MEQLSIWLVMRIFRRWRIDEGDYYDRLIMAAAMRSAECKRAALRKKAKAIGDKARQLGK